MRCDSLSLAGALQHEQLRQDGHSLEPDGEGPKDLGYGVLVWDDDGEYGSAPK